MPSKSIVTLEDLWYSFEASSIPRNTSDENRQMLKRAFYSGAGSTVSNIIRACDISSEFGTQVIDGFLDECVEFLRNLSEKTKERTQKASISS